MSVECSAACVFFGMESFLGGGRTMGIEFRLLAIFPLQ